MKQQISESGRQVWVSTQPEHLHAEYTRWIKKQHESFDVGAVLNEGTSVVIVPEDQHRKGLNITTNSEIISNNSHDKEKMSAPVLPAFMDPPNELEVRMVILAINNLSESCDFNSD